MDNDAGAAGVTLARLLLALDQTVASLLTHPGGLDDRIASMAMIDADDLRLGLSRDARGADLYLFVGVSEEAVDGWLAALDVQRPVAVMCKAPSSELVAGAQASGVAVIAVDPHARWERIYNLVSRVLDTGRDDAPTGPALRTGPGGDLFDVAAEVARRTHGLVSIEDERSHVLAYSSAGDEADELRRLSILGREGPPEMLAWLRQWGVMDALRTSNEVVEVDERADLGLRPRRAIAIRMPSAGGTDIATMGEFLGVVWLQQGSAPLSDDADDVLIGAAAVAARMISRRRAIGTEHDEVVRRLIGGRGDRIDADHLGDQLSIPAASPVLVVGFAARPGASGDAPAQRRLGDGGEVSALTLHASAFSPLSVTTTIGQRAYVVVPQKNIDATVRWARSAVAATAHQFSLAVQAVVAGPGDGLAAAPALRSQVDRVLDAAHAQGGLVVDEVTTIAASRTGVLLGEILGHLAEHPELVDPRVVDLAAYDARTGGELTSSLRAYLDAFGDVRSAAVALRVHPNTLRYRVRRAQELTGMDLTDPATRLVVALSLRAPTRSDA